MDEFLSYLLTFSVITLVVVFGLRSWLSSRREGGSSRRSLRRSSSRRHRGVRHRSSRRGRGGPRPLWRPFDERSNGSKDSSGPTDGPPKA
jgi:hypothetical protein